MKFNVYIDEECERLIITKEQAFAVIEYDIHGTTSAEYAGEFIKALEHDNE